MSRLLCIITAAALLLPLPAYGLAGAEPAGLSADMAAEVSAASPGDAQAPSGADKDGLTFTLYQGEGMFQGGSLSGPQAMPQAASPYALRRSAAPDPSEALYAEILRALQYEPTEYTIGGNRIFGVYISLAEYAFPGDDSSREAVYRLYARAINHSPDMFYFVPGVYFSVDEEVDPQQLSGMLMMVDSAAYAAKDSYEAETAAVLQDAFPEGFDGLSQTEIALALHDYLALHVTYHDAAADMGRLSAEVYNRYPSAFSAYGAIVEKQAVCHGISLAYKALLARCGAPIEAYLVPDYSAGHIWNLIELDGSWYHADITHAITGSGVPNHSLHDRFLLPDEEQAIHFPADNQADSWAASGLPAAEAAHPCAAFWRDISSAMFPVDGMWYYNTGSAGSGALARSAFGKERRDEAPIAGVGNVSYPVRIADRLYFYDYSNAGIYAYSPSAGIRTLRCTQSNFSRLYSPASLLDEEILPRERLTYIMANDATQKFYEAEDRGDVNADATRDVRDVVLLLQMVKENAYRTNEKFKLVHDNSFFVNDDDAVHIAKMVIGLAV